MITLFTPTDFQILNLTQSNLAQTEYLPVATTRPETIVGNTAICVHPSDPRYTHLIGKKAIAPLSFSNRLIPIIADDYVKLSQIQDSRISATLNEDGTFSKTDEEEYQRVRSEIVALVNDLHLQA